LTKDCDRELVARQECFQFSFIQSKGEQVMSTIVAKVGTVAFVLLAWLAIPLVVMCGRSYTCSDVVVVSASEAGMLFGASSPTCLEKECWKKKMCQYSTPNTCDGVAGTPGTCGGFRTSVDCSRDGYSADSPETLGYFAYIDTYSCDDAYLVKMCEYSLGTGKCDSSGPMTATVNCTSIPHTYTNFCQTTVSRWLGL
jgi:hypothetical protein